MNYRFSINIVHLDLFVVRWFHRIHRMDREIVHINVAHVEGKNFIISIPLYLSFIFWKELKVLWSNVLWTLAIHALRPSFTHIHSVLAQGINVSLTNTHVYTHIQCSGFVIFNIALKYLIDNERTRYSIGMIWPQNLQFFQRLCLRYWSCTLYY